MEKEMKAMEECPDGRVKKHKAQVCVHGDQQVNNVDYFDTYSHVVSWTTVWMIMTLAVNLGLKSRQVDYTNAFVQASLQPNEEAPLTWFNKLSQGLWDAGFEPSTLDPCLFFSKDVICIVYVDDCLMFSRDISMVDETINRMEKLGFQLCVEDDVAGFLGIKLERQEDSTIELKQDALIDHIKETVGFQHANRKLIPVEVAELPAAPYGPGPQENWSYSSVVGIPMYLASNSMPDITMAVHQCAPYSHNPRRRNKQAIKCIVHYLIGAKDMHPGKSGNWGMIIDPTDDLTLDCFCDAIFVGLWGHEGDQDPSC
eukprot:2753715-Ditylum_brightwellii.AAC.1